MDTGDLTIFKCDEWLSKEKGDKKIEKDLVAVIKGKAQLKSKYKNSAAFIFISARVWTPKF